MHFGCRNSEFEFQTLDVGFRSYPKSPIRRRGVSVVEVLIGASIIALALLAIASMFPTAYSNVEYGGKRTKAVALAQQKMEELRAGTFPPSSGGPETLEGVYTRRWTVTVSGTAPNQVATVTVTVSWSSVLGSKQVTLTSMMVP